MWTAPLKAWPMGERITLDELKEVAERLGIEVRLEPLKVEGSLYSGGYCRVRGKPVVILNKKAGKGEQMKVLVEALKRHDLSGMYLKPAMRKFLGLEDED